MKKVKYNIWHLNSLSADTGFAPKLTKTASVAKSVERWSRDPGSRVQFPARGLGVAFFATGPGWVLKCTVYILIQYLSDTRIYLTLKNLQYLLTTSVNAKYYL